MNGTAQLNDWPEILGYGQKIKALIGAKKERENDPESKMVPIFAELHLTPVAISDYEEAQQLVNRFFAQIVPKKAKAADSAPSDVPEAQQFETWSQDARNTGAKIIALALKKFHPDLDDEWVTKNLSVGTLATAISVVLDVNDFLRGTGALLQKIAVLKGQAPTLRPTNG